MLPNLHSNDIADLSLTNVKLSSELRLRHSLVVFAANLANILSSQLRHAMAFSARNAIGFGFGAVAFALGLTAFLISVVDVICLGAQEKVREADAVWDITTVEDFKSCWNRTVLDFPSYSMSVSTFSSKLEVAVATGLLTSCGPQPTSLSLVDLDPEPSSLLLIKHPKTILQSIQDRKEV